MLNISFRVINRKKLSIDILSTCGVDTIFFQQINKSNKDQNLIKGTGLFLISLTHQNFE